jgi:hypothetical protein
MLFQMPTSTIPVLAGAVSNMFTTLWPVFAVAIGIPLAFLITRWIKSLVVGHARK